jgi:ubiquitin-like-conjugating enzyme ATG3
VYTDAEEDAEQLLSMGGGESKEDEWVQTHAGRSESLIRRYLFRERQLTDLGTFFVAAPASHPDHIEDIPDDEAVAADMQNMSLKANESMPADDEIPDMEEDDLEDALNSNIVAAPKPAYVGLAHFLLVYIDRDIANPRLAVATSRRLVNTMR